jgi:trehalose 6-phosphate synthase
LTGLVQHVKATWIACANSKEDAFWQQGMVPFGEDSEPMRISFITPSTEAYNGYYNVIANPLLWFLQHSLWDLARSPVIDQDTWQAWEDGYQAINQQFAEEIVRQVRTNENLAFVMIQDYHLYLVGKMVRTLLKATRPLNQSRRTRLLHFVHIPWPGPEYWGILPSEMRQAIFKGLCAVDLLGFQTREDGLNFIRTCESYLPGAHVNFKRGRIWYQNHACQIRDFPISIDVEALRDLAASDETKKYEDWVESLVGDRDMILRIDRIDPSKNIIRGFQAFGEMLELYPEHRGQVKFVALLVPSRLGVDEYQDYLAEIMAAAGRVNAEFGASEWEPVRVLVGENYPRAVAALKRYNVLLVNSIADGMNLVAKEGPVVNRCDGVIVLSERTGANQQLGPGALVIAPCDIYATAQALHRALVMPAQERSQRAARMRESIEREDIEDWLCGQIETLLEIPSP